MARGARGEGYLDAEQGEYPILFTNRALAEAERALNMTVLEIARNASNLGVNAVAQLARIGLEASRRDRRDSRRAYTLDDAFDLLDSYGFAAVARVVVEALTAVLSYQRREGDDPPV